jgi:hypothetical protein
MKEARQHFLWLATVTYRTREGPVDVEHHFEEIGDLQAVVERGPAWSTIIAIHACLNPRCYFPPNDTVEAAELR